MIWCLDPTKCASPLHFKLRVLGNTYKFIYNLNSRWAYADRTPIWKSGVSKGQAGKDAYEEARTEFKEKLLEKCKIKIGEFSTKEKFCKINLLQVNLPLCYSNFFLLLDTVKPGGKGGGVDTGETSNQFFDPKNQEAILSLCTQVRILFHGFEPI